MLSVKEFRIQTTTPLTTFQSYVINETKDTTEEISRKLLFDVRKDNEIQSNSISLKLFNQILIIQLISVIYEMRLF